MIANSLFLDGRVTLHGGDCLDVLAAMPENSVDSVVCDPPYHLANARSSAGFMGKQWDGGDIAFRPSTWAAVLRVLKPGGYLLAFASTRGIWRMGVAIEDAGFINHPMIAWVFGSGFPKATRIKADGYEGFRYGGQALKPAIEPIYMGQKPFSEATGTANIVRWGTGAINIDATRIGGSVSSTSPDCARSNRADSRVCTCCAREAFQSCRNAGTRNQASSSVGLVDAESPLPNATECVLRSTGLPGSQVDCLPCHHSDDERARSQEGGDQDFVQQQGDGHKSHCLCAKCGHSREDHSKPLNDYTTRHVESKGRWPANLIHDGSEEVLSGFPETAAASGVTKGGVRTGGAVFKQSGRSMFTHKTAFLGVSDAGGSAARFFYSAKANSADRLGSKHPTVKPLDLMQYLVRLVTPPGGIVCDPFAGTGTTGEAAWREGMRAILIEREPEYQADIARRMALVEQPGKRAAVAKSRNKLLAGEGTPLFGDKE